jgi:hypothetical protein
MILVDGASGRRSCGNIGRVTVLPSADESTTGELPAVDPGAVRAPRRLLLLHAALGIGFGAVPSAALVAASAADPLVGSLAVMAVQVALVLAWYAGVRPPGRDGLATIALAAAVASDLAVHLVGHGRVTPVTGVVALAFVACIVAQLGRGVRRASVTEALGSGMSLTILACAFSAAVAVRDRSGGAAVLVFGVVAALVATGVALVCDIVVPRPAIGADTGRGLVGIAFGAAAGAVWGGIAPAVPDVSRGVQVGGAALIGVAAILTAVGQAYAAAGRHTEPGAHAAVPSRGPALARLALGPLLSVGVGVAGAYVLGLVVLS